MTNKDQIEKYYFDNPKIWEKLNTSRFSKESIFLQKIFERHNIMKKKILDIGCGTGSHLNILTNLGFSGTGIDLNTNMIEYAKKKYPHLNFQIKNMKNIDYINEFDAIICLCTTFCYNTTNEDVVTTLKAFNKALKKGGLLIIETFNPITFLGKKKFINKIDESDDYKKFNLKCFVEHEIDEVKQQMIEKRSFFNSKNVEVKTDITKFRLFFPQEMRYFLETNNFILDNFYGDYNIKNIKLDTFRMITVAKKL
ncbi:hypothetical protein CMU26_05750 [Elizabethkingia anophelis]|nr:hypothetical protein [Elizabethkingia anophelis]